MGFLERHGGKGSRHGGVRPNMWTQLANWLVVWNIYFFIFHNIRDNPSHWLVFFKMVKTTNQQKSALCQPKMMELMEHHRFSSAKRQYTELENGYGYWGYQWDKYPFFIFIYQFSSPIPIANSGISVGNGLNKQMAYWVLVKSCGQQLLGWFGSQHLWSSGT